MILVNSYVTGNKNKLKTSGKSPPIRDSPGWFGKQLIKYLSKNQEYMIENGLEYASVGKVFPDRKA